MPPFMEGLFMKHKWLSPHSWTIPNVAWVYKLTGRIHIHVYLSKQETDVSSAKWENSYDQSGKTSQAAERVCLEILKYLAGNGRLRDCVKSQNTHSKPNK